MATVNKRGNRWVLTWSKDGKQYRKTLYGISTSSEAETYRKGKEYELASGTEVFRPGITFDDHLREYLAWHSVKYPDSHWRTKMMCEKYMGDFSGKGLPQITKKDVEMWLTSRMTRVGKNRRGVVGTMSRGTVNQEFVTLSGVLSKAVEWGHIDASPTAGVDVPKSLSDAPIHWYSKDELARIYEDPARGNVWRLLANTGMRRSEVLRLRWVNVKEDSIYVISSEMERTKSGKWREIPLNKSARLALVSLKILSGASEYVVPHTSPRRLTEKFFHLVQRLGMPGSLHSLRHTYAGHLVLANVPLRAVQKLMGHASITTTEKYAFIGMSHLRDHALSIDL